MEERGRVGCERMRGKCCQPKKVDSPQQKDSRLSSLENPLDLYHTLTIQRYNTPTGMVGHRFRNVLTTFMTGIVDRRWNSEHLVVYPIIILQRKKGLVSAQCILWRIRHRLDLWDQGEFMVLTKYTEATKNWQHPMVQQKKTE